MVGKFYAIKNESAISKGTSISTLFAIVIAGLILVPVVSLFTPKPNPVEVDKMFECYNQTVTVNSTIALADEQNKENK